MSADATRNQPQQMDDERRRRAERVKERMGRIEHKILVLSGKGGVGKSTVAVNLAAALSDAGKKTGLLDVDVHGPSVPRLLGIEGEMASPGGDGAIIPVDASSIKVMSIGLLMNGGGQAVIWRGPMKHNVIVQLLGDTEWGPLDYLIVDAPPGTGDEPMSVCQLIPDADGAVVVTTPQEVAVSDVRRSIDFCRQLGVHVLGVVENMSTFVCPHCGGTSDPFGRGGGQRLASECGVPFLGSLPLEASVAEMSDGGEPFVRRKSNSLAAHAFAGIAEVLLSEGTKGVAGGDSQADR